MVGDEPISADAAQGADGLGPIGDDAGDGDDPRFWQREIKMQEEIDGLWLVPVCDAIDSAFG